MSCLHLKQSLRNIKAQNLLGESIVLRVFISILCLFLAFPTAAEDMSLYETKVTIEATGEDAAQARENALSQANRKALYAVVERISTNDGVQILNDLNDNQILNFIQEVSVITEKVNGNQYNAVLLMTVNAPVLKAYLAEKDIPMTITAETHALIVPVYRESETSAPLLWEENNPWYQAWIENQINREQTTILPIPNNRSNKNILTAEDAIQLNGFSLSAIRNNNDNQEIFIADAVKGNNSLRIDLKSSTAGTLLSKSYEGEAHIETLMLAAIQDIKSAVIKQLQQQTATQNSALNRITIVFNYPQLRDWLALQQAVKKIDIIQKTTMDAFANHRAQLTLDFTGELNNLIENFATQGFSLKDTGNFYQAERITQ